MMENLHIHAVDEHHVWINGRQFISLNRVNQMMAAYRDEIEWLKKCVNDLPKPVRCRDCIHLSGVTNGGTFFRCDRYDRWQDESNRVYMPLDGFCSYGQKKEET